MSRILGNPDEQHFEKIGILLGIRHSFGGIVMPGNTPNKVKLLIRTQFDGYAEYIKTRVCDAISGALTCHILGADYTGKLSSFEEDIMKGFDYIITDPKGNQCQIDFTQGEEGFSRKIHKKGTLTTVVLVNGQMLHALIRTIAARTQEVHSGSNTLEASIRYVYDANSANIQERFIQKFL